MPKLKPSDTELKDRDIRGLIAKKMELQDINEETISIKLHFTKRTFQNKRKNPDTFTLGELRRMSTILKFTDEEKAQIL